ncbi:MAG: hypothetical protein IPK19_27055 [Chloroflexi bacterium]|nr:hypothetical protein [Chloroflexota bacterium]
MSGAVTIRKVESERDFRAFFEFPWQVYKQDPHWVPPLLSMRRDLLDQKKNPDWKTMQGGLFRGVARRPARRHDRRVRQPAAQPGQPRECWLVRGL